MLLILREEEGYPGADRPRLAAGAEAVDRSDPGHPEARAPGRESRRAAVGLTSEDLRDIESAFSKIEAQGARLSEAHMALIDS